MILSCNHISKTYGIEEILNDCSFFINDYEKAAIVGNNGAGKSTILKIIMGELSADSGTVTIGKDKTIGYLAQYQDLNTDHSIYEEVKSVKKTIIDMEQKLKDFETSMSHVSGEKLKTLMNEAIEDEILLGMLSGLPYWFKSIMAFINKGINKSKNASMAFKNGPKAILII